MTLTGVGRTETDNGNNSDGWQFSTYLRHNEGVFQGDRWDWFWGVFWDASVDNAYIAEQRFFEERVLPSDLRRWTDA